MSKTSFRSIIAKWPSLAEFARDLGVSENTAKQMRTRDSIGIEHWQNLLASAKRRKIRGVTVEVLARLKMDGKPRPIERARAACAARRTE